MALSSLNRVLSLVPAYALDTSLQEIARTLRPLAGAVPSHIVVIDDQYCPLGAISLGRLWVMHSDSGAQNSTGIDRRLLDCQAELEPVVEVLVDQYLDRATLGALVAALGASGTVLVGVDAGGQYLGVVDLDRLLIWLAAAGGELFTPALPKAGVRAADAMLWSSYQDWVLDLGHALKTPITTLLGLSTLLLDSRVGSLSDRQFRYVSLMRQAIRKLTSLVNLLLDWMRLESGQICLNREQVSLQPLVDTLLPSFFNAEPEAKTDAAWVDGFTVWPASVEGWVVADPLRLRQSLHYGLDYLLAQGVTPEGLIIEPWGSWLGLTLWSSAMMPSSFRLPGLERPVGMFAEPRSIDGSIDGLKLTLARRFSQLHGGELSYLSTPTWGSRLTLLLPSPAKSPDSERTVLILLASADAAVIDRCYGCLQGSPYRLAIASSYQTLVTMQRQLSAPCTLLHWASLPDAPADAAARLALVQSLDLTHAIVLGDKKETTAADPSSAQFLGLALETLTEELRPRLNQLSLLKTAPAPPIALPEGLTMLLLRPPQAGTAPSALPLAVQSWLQRHRCRLLQVDDLAQASLLSRVWQPQAVILDSTTPVSLAYLRALAEHPALVRQPLVVLVPPEDGDAALTLDLPLDLNLVLWSEGLTQPIPQAVARLLQAIALPQAADTDQL